MSVRSSRTIALLVTVLLVTTTFAAAVQHDSTVTPRNEGSRTAIDPALGALMQRVSQNISTAYLKAELENLTSFKTRYCHASNHDLVLDWIFNEFKAMGYSPQRWGFIHQGFTNLADIIVNINGTGSSQFYIVSAHLDTINFTNSWNHVDSPAPGADDDGTGIVAMLAMAKVLQSYHFYYGIRFIAFDVEELDHAVGSTQYAQNITNSGEGTGLRADLNIDMIGYNPKYIRMDIVYVPSSIHIFNDYVQPANNEYSFITHLDTDPDPNDPNYWGDVDSFWKLGYQGISFEENVNPWANGSWYTANPNTHSANDSIDKINWVLFTNTTKLILTTLMWIARPTLPDLTVTDIVLSKAPIYEGDRVKVNATVSNIGDVNASTVQVDIHLDGKPFASMNVSVPAKSSANITYLWNSTAGHHIFEIKADPNDTIGEWDEMNNNASAAVTVLVRPDMALEMFDIVEDHVNSGSLAYLNVKVINHGPSYIECWLLVSDNRTPSMPVASDLVGLMADAEWSHVYNWASDINGTHRFDGQLTRCSPADKNESNDHLNDTIVVNGYPIASLSVEPKDGTLTFEDMVFSGAASFDDLGLASYDFDFGDGNESGWTNSSVVRHNYTREGTYDATLTVKDILGAMSTYVTRSVKVTDRPPVAVAKVDRNTTDTDAPVTFSSTGSIDPDGWIVQYNWTILPTGQTSSNADLTVRFTRSGNYTARLIVTDDSGNIASAYISVQIMDRPPKASISAPGSIQAGDLAHFSAKGSTDPDGTIMSYSWDFGDGSKASEMEPTHAFGNPGRYKVTLTVMDNDRITGTATWNMTVTKKPIIGKETLTDPSIWVFGACFAVILLILLYTAAPGPSRPVKTWAVKRRAKRPRRPKA